MRQFSLQVFASACALSLLSVPSLSNPTNYCVSAPNSVGPGAHIGWSGPIEVLQGGLGVRGAPPNVVGVFIVSTAATQTPFGDGFLCVGGDVVRLAIKPTDATGAVRLNLAQEGDEAYVEWMASGMSPVATWNFQYLYRDVGGQLGTGFNLTDGVRVSF